MMKKTIQGEEKVLLKQLCDTDWWRVKVEKKTRFD